MSLWACIACSRTYGHSAGPCPGCGIERLPIEQEDVEVELRAEAEARIRRWVYRDVALLVVPWVVVFIPLYFLGRLLIISPLWFLGWLLIAVPLEIFVRRRSPSVRLLAERRRRISAELGHDVQIDETKVPGLFGPTTARPLPQLRDARVPHSKVVDPLLLSGEALLLWLKMKRREVR